MENLNPKCDKKKYKICQIIKLQNKNETKNLKSFHVNYIHSILMFVSNIEILHAHCSRLSTLSKLEKLGFS
jgi:hypothetical protein